MNPEYPRQQPVPEFHPLSEDVGTFVDQRAQGFVESVMGTDEDDSLHEGSVTRAQMEEILGSLKVALVRGAAAIPAEFANAQGSESMLHASAVLKQFLAAAEERMNRS